MAKKSKASSPSPIVSVRVARHSAREQLRNADRALIQRHRAALMALDQADARAQIHGEVIRDFVSSRSPRTRPMAMPLPDPAPRPMATRLPPPADPRALVGIALSTGLIGAAMVVSMWLAAR